MGNDLSNRIPRTRRRGDDRLDRLPTRGELWAIVARQQRIIGDLSRDRARLAALVADYAVELEADR